MPNLGFQEILLILVIALIVFGPKRLPEIGRTVGKSLREFRRASQDIRDELSFHLDDEPTPVSPPASQPAAEAPQGAGLNGAAHEPASDEATERQGQTGQDPAS
jgi:sec-independent protein translocase protein TatA